MESCSYGLVNVNTIGKENISRKCFLRQMLVCSVAWMGFFVCGLSLGAPTVLIPQIRTEANSTDAVSDEMAMWLSATLGYGCIPWVVIIPVAAEYFGRRIPLIIICLNTFLAFLIFYLSNTVTQILISEVMESVIGAAVSTILVMVITEYSSPEYRGVFITFTSATMFLGIWVSNAIGTFFHWKYIGVTKLVCSIYSIVVVFYIPESPYWLASKSRFEECAELHRWLKGNNSELELDKVISSQRDYMAGNTSKSFSLKRTVTIILSKEFYKPSLLAMLLFSSYYLSGKLACTFYSLDIIRKITSSEKAAYIGMLILDGVSVFSMYIGTALSKCLQRRTLLLASSSMGVLFLFILFIYLYLIKLSYIVENHVLSLFFLFCYSLGICSGPMLLAPAISAEIIPLRYRGLSLLIISIVENSMMGITVQLLPYIIQRFGLEFAFLFFGFSCSICIVLLYLYLPEVKDKTLHEIADIMMGLETEIENELN